VLKINADFAFRGILLHFANRLGAGLWSPCPTIASQCPKRRRAVGAFGDVVRFVFAISVASPARVASQGRGTAFAL